MSEQQVASVSSSLIDVIDAPLHPAASGGPVSRALAAPLALFHGRVPLRPLIVAILALIIGAPLVAVFAQGLAAPDGLWAHLLATVFWSYVANTLLLCLGVGLITVVVGTSAAWLVSMFRFPGRRICEWALVLPMAMPAKRKK